MCACACKFTVCLNLSLMVRSRHSASEALQLSLHLSNESLHKSQKVNHKNDLKSEIVFFFFVVASKPN